MEKLTDRQWFVLNRAYRNYHSDENDGAVTTCHNGDYSISSNTCKSLVRLGLLSETGFRDTFRITHEGVMHVNQKQKQPAKLKESDPQAALEAWNRKVSGRK